MVVARDNTPINQQDVQGEHPGLIAQRFALKISGRPDKRENEKDVVKTQALEHAIRALNKAQEAYSPAFDLWERSFESVPEYRKRRLDVGFTHGRRVVVGLGTDSVIETGVTLLHTYGIPYLPGSSIKGMTSSYCHRRYGSVNAKFRTATQEKVNGQTIEHPQGDVHRLIFGSTKEVGLVVFHDAWIEPKNVAKSLKLDIITPHHTKYYGGGIAPPSDFDSPNIVSFLSVVGNFRVYLTIEERVEPQDVPNAKVVLDLAAKLVKEAFQNQGIGGKTSSGYGFIVDPETETGEEPLEENDPQADKKSN